MFLIDKQGRADRQSIQIYMKEPCKPLDSFMIIFWQTSVKYQVGPWLFVEP